MAKLGARDIILIIFSALIMGVSVCAITFGYEHVLRWFNLDAKYSRNKLGEVRQVDESSSRRKEFLTPEFRPLKERQAIFSNDTVMTGHESGLMIHFLDGSKVELAPDTLVEIKAREEGINSPKFHFEIRVEKGKVKGTSPDQTVKVKKAYAETVETVEVLKPEPLPVALVEAEATSSTVPAASAVPVTVNATATPQLMAVASPAFIATPTPAVAPQLPSTEIEIDFSYLSKKPTEATQKTLEKESKNQIKAIAREVKTLVEGPKIVDEWRPQLKLPENDSVLTNLPGDNVLFTWSSPTEAHEFLFELARKSSMNDLFFSTKTKLNFTQAKLLQRGTYYWRVTDLETGQRSQVGKFNL
jgi:hypothetical protein